MTRSPLFYPLHRGDSDAGGAADLQTDIMRFMAILALCLVAIFALVQSIPLIPEAPAESTAAAAPPPAPVVEEAKPEPVAAMADAPAAAAPEKTLRLTRPKWKSTFVPRQRATLPTQEVSQTEAPEQRPAKAAETVITPAPRSDAATNRTSSGFTLRFESDRALTRLVAAGKVGLYAIDDGKARRMTVSDNRISFWEASTPSSFHEMETTTVPRPVVDALARSGVSTASIDWGVTLPGSLKKQLDTLMREHTGGALVIGLDGTLRLEQS